MKALRYFVIVISSLIALGFFLLWYVGVFDKVDLEKRSSPSYLVAGYNFKGSYQQIGPIMGEVDSLLRLIGVNSTKGFGIYFNDPNTTPEAELESYVGNVIEGDSRNRIEEILSLGLQVDTIPAGTAWVASMAIRSQFSYMVGPIRAYPMLEEAVKEADDEVSLVYEIYDLDKKIIHYSMLVQP